ncbi:hypothetical protein LJC42_03290 [Eubacteriales bacterium OttesenSCG-928-K08]|nr:hypothetical protein [Eubacteriales bacterium OttesenSCG-928-K08]
MVKSNGQSAQNAVERLISERKWESFHKPRFLVSALMVECGELMNFCLWKTPEEIDELFTNQNPDVVKELADIAINLLSLLKYADLDLNIVVSEKVQELLERYDHLPQGTHRGDKGKG